LETLLNTLYLTLPGCRHLDNDTLRFEVEQETRLRVPLHHIDSVVCFG
jgi:CRISPR-associated protein Cas1